MIRRQSVMFMQMRKYDDEFEKQVLQIKIA